MTPEEASFQNVQVQVSASRPAESSCSTPCFFISKLGVLVPTSQLVMLL